MMLSMNYMTFLMRLYYKTWSGSGAIVGEDLPGRTVIGCNNKIGHHAVVGIRCQDMKYKVDILILLTLSKFIVGWMQNKMPCFVSIIFSWCPVLV